MSQQPINTQPANEASVHGRSINEAAAVTIETPHAVTVETPRAIPVETPRIARRGNSKIAWLAVVPALLIAGALWKSRSAPPAGKGEKVAATGGKADDAGGDTKGEGDAAEPIAVEVAPVVVRPLETVVAARGTLVAAQGANARVAVVAPGRLTRVLVREGDRVTTGQLLALVDNRTAAAGERSAAAALSASLADARQAQLTTRATQSDQTNALRQAQLALQSAIAGRAGAVRQANIALRAAQSDLRRAQVGARAPDVSNALQQARLALRAARLDRDTGVKAARNALQAAQTDLDKLRAGARPQEIRQAQSAVTQAQATRDRAATEVERVQFLFDKGIKAKRELDDARTALNVSESALQSAQDQLSLLQAGARVQEIRAAELGVSGARDALEAAQSSGDAKILQAQSALQLARGNVGQAAQQRPEDVRAATLKVSAARDAWRQAQQSGEAAVLQARAALQAASQGGLQIAARNEDARAKQALVSGKTADLSAAQVAAASSELRAPLGGVITRRNLNPGDMADPATPVVEISDAGALNLIANLSGESGDAVRQGMAARVATSGAPHHFFMGRVASVGQIDPQTNLLTVRIAVPNRGGALRIGAFATADIILQTEPFAVMAPQAAMLARDGKSVVLTVGADDKAHQKTVVTGTQRNGLVEIVSGLKPGERVIRSGGYQLDDGAPVKIGGKPEAAKPQAAKPQAAKPQAAKPQAATSEAGARAG